nr:hypothetical protein [Russula griseocarnosa]
MNINLIFEIILLLFAILASNGIIYSLTFIDLNKNKQNFSENISVITNKNNSEKNVLAFSSLIASNPIRLASSDSNTSQSLSMVSSDSSTSQNLSMVSSNTSQSLSTASSDTMVSQNLSVASSDTMVSQNAYDNMDWIDSEINERVVTHTENAYLASTRGNTPPNVGPFDNTTSLDSRTILDSQSLDQWREIAMDLHELPINTPAHILQQVKFEELNILYSQDIINFAITQTELRLIIEHLPATSLFKPGINHLILTIMSYYHL